MAEISLVHLANLQETAFSIGGFYHQRNQEAVATSCL